MAADAAGAAVLLTAAGSIILMQAALVLLLYLRRLRRRRQFSRVFRNALVPTIVLSRGSNRSAHRGGQS